MSLSFAAGEIACDYIDRPEAQIARQVQTQSANLAFSIGDPRRNEYILRFSEFYKAMYVECRTLYVMHFQLHKSSKLPLIQDEGPKLAQPKALTHCRSSHSLQIVFSKSHHSLCDFRHARHTFAYSQFAFGADHHLRDPAQ